MKFYAALTAALCLAVSVSSAPSPLKTYIIKLKPAQPQALVRQFIVRHNREVGTSANVLKYQYNPKIINAVAGTFTSTFLEAVQGEHGSAIEYIVPDGIATIVDDSDDADDGEQTSPPSWGLTRVSQRKLDLTKPHVYPKKGGEGVDVYVVDTGLQAEHKDFGGRATFAKSFVASEPQPNDGNGHGTHCAGTVGSDSYGVARAAKIYGVKVLGAFGSGTWADVIAGISFAATDKFDGTRPRVISMSLGGGKNQGVDDAVDGAVKNGVAVIAAAGNNYGQDACTLSPAGAKGTFTVAASDNADKMASFSNKGPCVEIFAPGVDITSLWKGAEGATNKISGTSMSTPHVAGIAAIYLSKKKYAAVADLYADLQASATKDAIVGLTPGTANLMAYNKPN